MTCGPFIAATMNGMVRNGPTPTMLMMLVAVACSRPIDAIEARGLDVPVALDVASVDSSCRAAVASHSADVGQIA